VLVAGAPVLGTPAAGGVVAVLGVAPAALPGTVTPPEGAYVVVGVLAAPVDVALGFVTAPVGTPPDARADAGTGNVGVPVDVAARATEGAPAQASTSSAMAAATALRERRRPSGDGALASARESSWP
jgi:hypothetical protein